MSDEKRFSIEEVRAAFETLEDHVAKQGADAGCIWAIHYAAEDVLSILGGAWEVESPAAVESTPEEKLTAACPGCAQTLEEVRRSGFACPECYGLFGDEALEAIFAAAGRAR